MTRVELLRDADRRGEGKGKGAKGEGQGHLS